MAETYHYAGRAIATRDQPLLVVYNNETTRATRKIQVIKLDVQPFSSTTTTPGAFALAKITGLSGGSDIPIIKASEANASIAPEILLKTNADVVLSGEEYRSHLILPISTQGLSLMGVGRNYAGNTPRSDTGSLFDCGYINSSCQRIVLREGEGIALVPNDQVNLPSNAAWYWTATLQIGSETYYTYNAIYATAGSASFALYNGTGSGQIIQIVDMNVTYMGPTTITSPLIDSPYVRFIKIARYIGGEEVELVQRDTSVPTPAAIKVVRNRFYNPMQIRLITDLNGLGEGELLYPEQNTAVFRRIGIVRQSLTHLFSIMAPGLASSFWSEFMVNDVQHGIDFRSGNSISPLTLNPGEGLAVVVNNATPFCAYWCDLLIKHITPIDANIKRVGSTLNGAF